MAEDVVNWGAKTAPEEKKETPQVVSTPKRRIGYKVGVYGFSKVGKSYFEMTFPKPLRVLSTDFTAEPVREEHFSDQDIEVLECFVEDESNMYEDANLSLKEVEKNILYLKKTYTNYGITGWKENPHLLPTVCLDTGTDIWAWCRKWMITDVLGLDSTMPMRKLMKKREDGGGGMQQTDWDIANTRYEKIMLRLISLPTNLVVTGQKAEEYDRGQKTGNFYAQWQKKTPYWLDYVINIYKDVKGGFPKYYGAIEETRRSRSSNEQILDIDFEKFVANAQKLRVKK